MPLEKCHSLFYNKSASCPQHGVPVLWNKKSPLNDGCYPWHALERKGCFGQKVPVFQQKWPEQKKFDVHLPPKHAYPDTLGKHVVC